MRKQYRSRTRTHPISTALRKNLAAVIVLAVVGLAVSVGGVLLSWQSSQVDATGVISVVIQEDDRTAAVPDAFLDGVADAAIAMAAAKGGGTVVVHKVAGGDPIEVGRVSLRVLRGGQPEMDTTLRDTEVRRRLAELFEQARTATVTGEGRSLTAVAKALAADRPDEHAQWSVFYYGLGLFSEDPVDMRVLMAADPSIAIESLPDTAFSPLGPAQVHLTFASPAGGQDPVESRLAAWRDAFLGRYLTRSGAEVAELVEPGLGGDAAPGSPAAPLFENPADPTQPPPVVPGAPFVTTLDTSMFYPDEDRLLSESDAIELLRPVAEAWRSGGYRSIECVGRIAAFLPPDSDVGIDLSQRRADRIVALLSSAFSVPATGRGVGSSDPLPGDPRSPVQRSVICTAIPAS